MTNSFKARKRKQARRKYELMAPHLIWRPVQLLDVKVKCVLNTGSNSCNSRGSKSSSYGGVISTSSRSKMLMEHFTVGSLGKAVV